MDIVVSGGLPKRRIWQSDGLSGGPNTGLWIWVDAAAFDESHPDCGCTAYLDNIGFIPDAISFLVSCPDFVHLHDGQIDYTPLRAEYYGYFGRVKGRNWTKKRLHTLINELRNRGVQVYLGAMANAAHPNFETKSEWAKKHPEILMMDQNGSSYLYDDGKFGKLEIINPLSRLSDGTFYQDFFAGQLARTLADYGFDGFHAADGYKSMIKTLDHVSFSPDMIDQFETATGISIPIATDEGASRVAVAQWILEHHRIEWIEFYRMRWAQFYKTLAVACHSGGKRLIANSSWGCSPLDSTQRFGIDLQKSWESGVECIVFEDNSPQLIVCGPPAAPDTKSRRAYFIPREELRADFDLALLLQKTHAPKMRFYPFIPLHDSFERLENIRTQPSLIEKLIYSNAHKYLLRNGEIIRTAEGATVTLGNDIRSRDWETVVENCRAATETFPIAPPGPVVVWSDSTLDAEIPNGQHTYGLHRRLYEHAAAGLQVISAVRVEDIATADPPFLLWVNPGSFNAEEVEILSARMAIPNRRMAVLGQETLPEIPSGKSAIVISALPASDWCLLLGNAEDIKLEFARARQFADEAVELGIAGGYEVDVQEKRGQVRYAMDISAANPTEPYELTPDLTYHFLARIPPRRLDAAFARLTAQIVRTVAWPAISDIWIATTYSCRERVGGQVSYFYIPTAEDEMTLCLMNHTPCIAYLTIETTKKIRNVETPNSVLFVPPPNGNVIQLAVPADGVLVAKLEFLNRGVSSPDYS